MLSINNKGKEKKDLNGASSLPQTPEGGQQVYNGTWGKNIPFKKMKEQSAVDCTGVNKGECKKDLEKKFATRCWKKGA